ncbi:MAG: hypothetical protein ACTSUB_00680 [Candidatus Thorarchaeota archaeon]
MIKESSQHDILGLIEVHDDQHNLIDLLNRVREAEPQEGLELFTRIGRLIEEPEFDAFKELAEDILVSGAIDIENWTRTAMRAVIMVCSERGINISFKNGERTLSFVSYPKKGVLLESFIDGIITGEW